ncbi:hypothetical protein E1200_27510 [Actinomadura sp. GC306]|uniref:hypothetical protein n=1 Tax=Actinomadura sp. GC306 TaxID=2530367 RepID=UPI0010489F04|nr:hypothetical protein [Actinomadura sp. GC306]TDC61948.1 hypothetical protein E1200_27510 [Actinomadura sp. GC306]
MQAGTYEWKSDFALKHIAEGEARGEAKLLLTVLETRGFTIDDDLRERITTCQDHEQLHTWARRATTAESLDEVLS